MNFDSVRRFDSTFKRPIVLVQSRLGEGCDGLHGGDSWELEGTPPCFFLFPALVLYLHTDPKLPTSAERMRTRNARTKRTAFTLVEATVAMSITAIAGAAFLLAVEGTINSSRQSVDETIANGLARQIIDEVLGTRFMAPGATPYQWPLVPNSWELAGDGRERFNDTDDFNGFTADGAEGIWGFPLGTGDDQGGQRHHLTRVPGGFFDNWQQEIEVYYVSPTNPGLRLGAGQTSDLRCVEVRINKLLPDGSTKSLALMKRVYAYVPPPTL